MKFSEVAVASEDVAATRKRLEKIARLAEVLGAADDDLAIATAYLSGRLPQGRIGVGYASLRDIRPKAAAEPSLTLRAVDATFARLQSTTGAGSQDTKKKILADLFSAATKPEQGMLRGLLSGGLRQGALDGVMAEALARAFDVPAPAVRRAAMLSGDLGAVAVSAADKGADGLLEYRLTLNLPLQPMLASTSQSPADAVNALGDVFVDWKVDGARVQIHWDGSTVRGFTRNLKEVTSRLPELASLPHHIGAATAVLDAEVIRLHRGGTPRPFQETMSRFGRRRRDTDPAAEPALTVFVFDALHLAGDDLIDSSLEDRLGRLEAAVSPDLLVAHIRTESPDEAEAFFQETLALGHEGVMVKAASSTYAAGRRGSDWLKVKPAHTLDLVVLAVEWGSGRRQGWLSNLHLGAYDPAADGFVMLGKTFKGLTDELLEWQTQRFLELEERRDGHVVYVRPEQVVEVAFDAVQTSTRYPGGVALRFARVKGYRADKSAREADTIDTVRAIHRGEL